MGHSKPGTLLVLQRLRLFQSTKLYRPLKPRQAASDLEHRTKEVRSDDERSDNQPRIIRIEPGKTTSH